MYKVYKVEPQMHYHGMSLVAAESAEEANSIIADFKKDDTNNWNDSWGYCEVDESDAIEGVFSEHKGIVLHGIYYYGWYNMYYFSNKYDD